MDINKVNTVCLLNDSFPPYIDGVANTVMNYATHIREDGGNPIVLTPQHPQADDSQFPYQVLRYRSIDTQKLTGYRAGVPFSPEVAHKLSSEQVSVLHSHCPIISTLLGRQLRQIACAPLILTYHTKFDIDIANVIKSKRLQSGSKKILVENINACDEVWTVSHGAGENLRSLGYEGDYIVMPNGVDIPRGRVSDEEILAAISGYDLPDGVPVYLFVGRIMWYKGLRLIVDALAGLREANKDFRMVFVGNGADMDELKAHAAKCGVLDKCIFPGAIHDRQTLRAWYSRADLFLFPSTYDTNGLVVREAAACGLASVLIRGSCAAEGVLDGVNGFLVDETPVSLFYRLLQLHGQPDIMASVGEHAAEQLYISWKDAVTAAVERYEVVIDRYRSGNCPRYRKPMEYYLKANGELMDELGQFVALGDMLRQYKNSGGRF